MLLRIKIERAGKAGRLAVPARKYSAIEVNINSWDQSKEMFDE